MAPQLLLIALIAQTPPADPMVDLLDSELERASEVLADQEETPHYIGLAVQDETTISVTAKAGTVSRSYEQQARYLDIDLRVGTPTLDSSHPLRGTSDWRNDTRRRVALPIEDTPDFALRHAIWRELDSRYRDASEAIVMVRANQAVKVAEEDPAPDFEPRSPLVYTVEVPPLEVDRAAWEPILVELSERLDASPRVHRSAATLQASSERTTFADTEGTRLSHGTNHLRVLLSVSATAADGDRIRLGEHVDVHTIEHLPSADMLHQEADALVRRLEALLDAPRGEPFSGPVILRGRAAGVFIHEILGHRLEGHRQKKDYEGKTFKEYVGKPILPAFIDIVDDPTMPTYGLADLNGFYWFDDEGVESQRTVLVEDGVLVGFLMGRSPIDGFEHSNGHGRRSTGRAPVSRMGNTILSTDDERPFEELREMLVAEIGAQGLAYGMIVDEIDGGFTSTGRFRPNSFNVRARTAWRVYADGRPDELIRGVDLVGTPLEAFGNLVAAGDDPEVFNGYCGAESGSVPVSSISPSLFLSSLEFQLKEKGSDRPPLLGKPGTDEDGQVGAEVTP